MLFYTIRQIYFAFVYTTLMNKVRAGVEATGESIAAVARKAGISRQLMNYFMKQGYVTTKHAKRFCKATGLKLEDVLP